MREFVQPRCTYIMIELFFIWYIKGRNGCPFSGLENHYSARCASYSLQLISKLSAHSLSSTSSKLCLLFQNFRWEKAHCLGKMLWPVISASLSAAFLLCWPSFRPSSINTCFFQVLLPDPGVQLGKNTQSSLALQLLNDFQH